MIDPRDQFPVELNDMRGHLFYQFQFIDSGAEIIGCQHIIHMSDGSVLFFPVFRREIRILQILNNHSSADLLSEIIQKHICFFRLHAIRREGIDSNSLLISSFKICLHRSKEGSYFKYVQLVFFGVFSDKLCYRHVCRAHQSLPCINGFAVRKKYWLEHVIYRQFPESLQDICM